MLQQTFNFQVKRAAVKLVLVGDLAPVIPSVAVFRLYNVHFKCVDLTINRLTGQSVLRQVAFYLFAWLQRLYLCESVKCFFELQVLSSLAGQIHPFSFKPLDGGFAEEILGLHFGNEAGISTFRSRKPQIKWLLAALYWNACIVVEKGVQIDRSASLFGYEVMKSVFVQHTGLNIDKLWWQFLSLRCRWQKGQFCLEEAVGCDVRTPVSCLQPWTTVSATNPFNG